MSTLAQRRGVLGRLQNAAQSGVGLAGILVLGGWLHGLASRFGWIWQPGTETDNAQTDGVSPLELVIVAIAARALFSGPAVALPAWPAVAFVLLLLVPSNLASNAALLAYATWVATHTRGGPRAGAWLFAGLAACALWWLLGGRLLGDAPLRADAAMTEAILRCLLAGVERAGNVVGIAGGHKIVVLAGCSTLNGLPLTLLALAALSLRDGRLPVRFGRTALIVAVLYTLGNAARLTVLGLSADLYHVGHGSTGQMVFDALSTLLPLAMARRPPPSDAAPIPMAAPAVPSTDARVKVPWPAVLLGLLAVGLCLTLFRLATPPPPPRELRAEDALVGFLGGHGWQPVARRDLTGDGGYPVYLFAHPGCPAPMAVAIAIRAPEAASMLRVALGDDIGWLEAGTLHPEPPLEAHAWHLLWAAAVARLGGPRDRVMPMLAIAPTPREDAACAPPPPETWRDLARLP